MGRAEIDPHSSFSNNTWVLSRRWLAVSAFLSCVLKICNYRVSWQACHENLLCKLKLIALVWVSYNDCYSSGRSVTEKLTTIPTTVRGGCGFWSALMLIACYPQNYPQQLPMYPPYSFAHFFSLFFLQMIFSGVYLFVSFFIQKFMYKCCLHVHVCARQLWLFINIMECTNGFFYLAVPGCVVCTSCS